MAKFTNRHVIDGSIYLFQQENSSRWYARFKVKDTWYTRATKQKELKEAIVRAIKLQTEFEVMVKNKLPIHTTRKYKKRSFNAIADLAIKRIEEGIEAGANSKKHNEYIGAINNYLKPFFNDCMFRQIDDLMLARFDKWREEKLGRMPAKSTVKGHNVALRRVFDEAIINNCITESELPLLTNKGRADKRRAHFTKEEFRQIVDFAKDWIETGRRRLTRDIRMRLYYYIQIAAYTGMRPGTEMENLTWSDISSETENGKPMIVVSVNKGKTTVHTGSRRVLCKNEVLHLMEELILSIRPPKWQLTDRVFGDTTEFGKNFVRLLKILGLKNSSAGDRTIYSLRHSYVTWMLLDKVPVVAIAKQIGSSPQMIMDYYSHVTQLDYIENFAGKHATD